MRYTQILLFSGVSLVREWWHGCDLQKGMNVLSNDESAMDLIFYTCQNKLMLFHKYF
jgi:hypothetical protein